MSQYIKKETTGREYVDATKEFCTVTTYRCTMLPKRWENILIIPLVRDAQGIEDLIVEANKIYLNEKNMGKEELIKGYQERIEMLQKAIRKFADYDIKFERLMSHISITASEKNRLTRLFYTMANQARERDPNVKELIVKVSRTADEMVYQTIYGNYSMKLHLTAKNKKHWIDVENIAKDWIKKRIEWDKKAIARLKA